MKTINLINFPALITDMRKNFVAYAKYMVILPVLAVVTAGCEKTIIENGEEPIISKVNFTPCQQSQMKSTELSSEVDVEFTNEGLQITYSNFAVTCDFSIVNVTHTFVNGLLDITQQGSPNQADCVCYTDVSYTINGISQNDVNVIFINGIQVYCHNNNNGNEEGYISDCDQDVIVSATEYENAPNDHVEIIDMKIEGNCLNIKFSASGCSVNSLDVNLIDSGFIGYSIVQVYPPLPPKRTLRLSFDKKDDCLAVFTKEVSFNIEDLQVRGEWGNKVYLEISGIMILYEF